jgi:hypothetical protein
LQIDLNAARPGATGAAGYHHDGNDFPASVQINGYCKSGLGQGLEAQSAKGMAHIVEKVGRELRDRGFVGF